MMVRITMPQKVLKPTEVQVTERGFYVFLGTEFLNNVKKSVDLFIENKKASDEEIKKGYKYFLYSHNLKILSPGTWGLNLLDTHSYALSFFFIKEITGEQAINKINNAINMLLKYDNLLIQEQREDQELKEFLENAKFKLS